MLAGLEVKVGSDLLALGDPEYYRISPCFRDNGPLNKPGVIRLLSSGYW